jgi:hypothetical protein
MPVVEPIPLPPGTVQIVGVRAMQWGGEVTVVDAAGVETTHKTSDAACLQDAVTFRDQRVPVVVTFGVITRGKNKGREKLAAIHAFEPDTPPAPEPPDPPPADDLAF